MKTPRSERAPWGDFPDLVRNGGLGDLSEQPEYTLAKGGDVAAALDIALRLIDSDAIARMKTLGEGASLKIVPVISIEESGANKIPLAFAEVIADQLGCSVEYGIVQSEKVFRTGANADHRLTFNPRFSGDVIEGQNYIIVDDTLAMGGTLASLRGFIENRGGNVVAAFAATSHEGSISMPVKQAMLDKIEHKHGPAMNEMWQEEFGYGIGQLTQSEAGHLRKAASVDVMRNRIAEARREAGWSVDEKRDPAAQGADDRFKNSGALIANMSHKPLVGSWSKVKDLVESIKRDRSDGFEP